MTYTVAQQQLASDPACVVVTMVTPSYRAKAERLAQSLRALGLPHAICEVPAVHRSISAHGIDDSTFSKPRFIAWALRRFARPVLYVDGDCVFCQPPDLLASLVKDQTDFAAYNWYSDLTTDAWVPHEKLAEETKQPRRYWRFSHAIDDFSVTQLAASGAVQYWSPSAASLALLDAWSEALARFARSCDDECLSYAFNFAAPADLRYRWLPKEYARCAWWIYARPVIDHPELPTPNGGHFELLGEKNVDTTQLTRAVGKPHLFPREAIIDAVDKLILLRQQPDGRFKPAARLSLPLFIP